MLIKNDNFALGKKLFRKKLYGILKEIEKETYKEIRKEIEKEQVRNQKNNRLVGKDCFNFISIQYLTNSYIQVGQSSCYSVDAYPQNNR
jgi:predicted RNA-binding protein Jag